MPLDLLNRWFSAAATLLVFMSIVAEAALGASASRVPQELRQKAQREGAVRVIVQLAVDATGSSPYDHESLRSWRRANIAQAQDSLRGGLRGLAHRVHHQFRDVPSIALELDSAGLQTLDSLPGLVSQVFEDKLERSFLLESTALVQGNPTLNGVTYDGSGTVVAILDTGVDKNHPFLGNVVAEACFSSNVPSAGATSVCPGGVTSSFAAGSGLPCSLASCRHGTHVAGIATGNGQNGAVAGFSGVAKGANVMSVQVFSLFNSTANCGSATPCVLAFNSDIMAGLQWVYDLRAVHNFAAVNMSLGGGGSTTACDSDPRKPIIDLLRAANIATVIASGNNGFTNAISAPGCISSAVSVGSTFDGSPAGTGIPVNAVSTFSNSASFLSLLAPGQVITSSVSGGGYANLQGTSMATPHVAGAFAVLKQAMPNLKVSQALAALQAGGLSVLDTRNGITKPRIRVRDALVSLNPQPTDTTAPAAVNLTVGSITANSVSLSWNAPGDDNGSGTAASYDIRYGLAVIGEANWGAVSQAAGEPVPSTAGSAQSFIVTGLSCGTSYFFALRSADEVPNLSALSNSPTAVTLSCPDNIAPNTSITVGPTGTIAVNSASFTWTGSDNVTATANLVYAYRLAPLEASFSAFGSATSRTYSNLANGPYTFHVQARDGANLVDQSPATRSFTVSVPLTASIQVTAPNGGESWRINSQQTIRWTSSNLSGSVSIQVSRNGGTSWASITSSTANDGSRNWQVSGPTTTAARIRVCSVANPALCDSSNANFTIRN